MDQTCVEFMGTTWGCELCASGWYGSECEQPCPDTCDENGCHRYSAECFKEKWENYIVIIIVIPCVVLLAIALIIIVVVCKHKQNSNRPSSESVNLGSLSSETSKRDSFDQFNDPVYEEPVSNLAENQRTHLRLPGKPLITPETREPVSRYAAHPGYMEMHNPYDSRDEVARPHPKAPPIARNHVAVSDGYLHFVPVGNSPTGVAIRLQQNPHVNTTNKPHYDNHALEGN